MKLLSQRLESARTLALYSITIRGESSVDVHTLPIDVGLSTSSGETHRG